MVSSQGQPYLEQNTLACFKCSFALPPAGCLKDFSPTENFSPNFSYLHCEFSRFSGGKTHKSVGMTSKTELLWGF